MNLQKPELLVNNACHTGEGPIWHALENRLYYVDITNGKVYWYSPLTEEEGTAFDGEQVGGVTIQEDGGLVLFLAGCAVKILKNDKLHTVIDKIPGEENTRFNDEITDTKGRVIVGTMSSPDRKGRLYQIAHDGSYRVISDGSDTETGGYGTPNGMGFTPDRKRLYFNDSKCNRTYLFDYHSETGELSNRIIFRDGSAPSRNKPELTGRGDGMTVDAAGNLWMGEWDGGRIVCYSCDESFSPKPTMLLEYPIPAKKVSCLTFGGIDYRDLYITTANRGGDSTEEGEGAGALFRIKTDVQGLPEFKSRILI